MNDWNVLIHFNRAGKKKRSAKSLDHRPTVQVEDNSTSHANAVVDVVAPPIAKRRKISPLKVSLACNKQEQVSEFSDVHRNF